jgi:hypothetical protein
MDTGIIYFIQPSELVGTNRFKIGCSKHNNLDRCKNGYRNGSRYLCIMECKQPFVLENTIKISFRDKFTLITGNEFFEGDEQLMFMLFMNIVVQHKYQQNIVPSPIIFNNNTAQFKNTIVKLPIKDNIALLNNNKFIKNCDILGIINTEQAIKFKFIIENEFKLTGFFNFQYLMKNNEFLKQQLNFKTNKNVITKILLLREFETKMNIDKLDIQMNNFNIDKIEKLNENEIKHFQNIFRTTKTQINTYKQIQKFYIGLIKNICGELNIITCKQIKDKQRNNITTYSFDNKLINNCFELIKLKDEYLINYNDDFLKILNITKPNNKNHICNNEYEF